MNELMEYLFHTEHKIWYLGPFQHFIMLLLINAIFLPFLFHTLRMRHSPSKMFHESPHKPLSLLEQLCGVLLAVFQVLQIIYKFLRGWDKLLNLLFPCHIVCGLQLYSWYYYSRSHGRASVAFNLNCHFLQFVALALVIPDISDVRYPGQVLTFWGHHIFLFLFPILLLWNERFHLDYEDHYYWRLAMGIGTLFFYNVQCVASLLFDVNINYMVHPPPPSFLRGLAYRWKVMPLCYLLSYISGYVMWKISSWREAWNRYHDIPNRPQRPNMKYTNGKIH